MRPRDPLERRKIGLIVLLQNAEGSVGLEGHCIDIDIEIS